MRREGERRGAVDFFASGLMKHCEVKHTTCIALGIALVMLLVSALTLKMLVCKKCSCCKKCGQ